MIRLITIKTLDFFKWYYGNESYDLSNIPETISGLIINIENKTQITVPYFKAFAQLTDSQFVEFQKHIVSSINVLDIGQYADEKDNMIDCFKIIQKIFSSYKKENEDPFDFNIPKNKKTDIMNSFEKQFKNVEKEKVIRSRGFSKYRVSNDPMPFDEF